MNAATALRFAARTPVAPAAAAQSEARCVRAGDLLAPVIDALAASFSLSAVEVAVTRQVLAGRSCERIAARLGLRETTVHKHLHRVCAKTGSDSRQQLFDLGLRLAARGDVVRTPAMAA